MPKPPRQLIKHRYHCPKPTEGQWRFFAATLNIAAAVIEFFNHLK